MTGWQWHQLNHMQVICTLLQTDNHASTSSLKFLWAGCPSCHPTNSVKALKAQSQSTMLCKYHWWTCHPESTKIVHTLHSIYIPCIKAPKSTYISRKIWFSSYYGTLTTTIKLCYHPVSTRTPHFNKNNPLISDRNFHKWKLIFKILSLPNSHENSLCTSDRGFHLTITMLLHYLMKFENSK